MIFLKCVEYLQRNMRADGKEIRALLIFHANGRQGSQGEINCTETPQTLFEFQPSLPESPCPSEATGPLPSFADSPPCPRSALQGSGHQLKTVKRWTAGGKRRCRELRRQCNNGSRELLALHGACNPVFWERDWRCQKSTFYAVL